MRAIRAGLTRGSVLVNVWNLSSWPAYKSRFWNKAQGGARYVVLRSARCGPGCLADRAFCSAAKASSPSNVKQS